MSRQRFVVSPRLQGDRSGSEAAIRLVCGALDEVAFLGLRNDIHVPILALAQMAKAATSFLHMPEVVVARDQETDLEVDLWAIVDGRIVLGEAKKGDVLAETQDEETARCAATPRARP